MQGDHQHHIAPPWVKYLVGVVVSVFIGFQSWLGLTVHQASIEIGKHTQTLLWLSETAENNYSAEDAAKDFAVRDMMDADQSRRIEQLEEVTREK